MVSKRKSKVLSLSLSQGLLTLITLFSSMVFTRIITKDSYATYLQTFLAYDFVKPILTLGLPVALYNLLPNEARGKKIVLEVVLLLFGAGVFFSLFMFLGGTDIMAIRFNNPELSVSLRWMTIFPLYTYPVLCLSSILIVNNQVKINSWFNVVTGVLMFGLIIISLWVWKDYEHPLAVRVLFPLLVFPFGLYYCFHYTKGQFEKPELSNMWRILKFAVPLGLATMIASIATQFSNIVVSTLCSPSDYAVYSIGAKEIPFISVVTGSIAVVVMADMSLLIKKGEINNSLNLFHKSAISSSFFLMPVMVFLFVFANYFVQVLFSSSYSDSAIPFRIFLLYLPIRIVQYNSVFIAFGQSKAVLLRSAIHLLFTIIFCVLFVWLWGYWGAAVGAIAASYLWAVPYNIKKLSELFRCRMLDVLPIKKICLIFLISCLCGILSSLAIFFKCNMLITLIVGAAIFIISYYILMKRYFVDFKTLFLWKRS